MKCYMLSLDMNHNRCLNLSFFVAKILHTRIKLQQNVPDKKKCMMMFFMLHWLSGEARSKSHRAQLSKSIRRHLLRALGEQRNARIQHVLHEFKVLDRLSHHARAPIPLLYKECFGPNVFANFLENNIGSEIGFTSPNYKTLLRRETKTIRFRNIERFTVDEAYNALKHRRRNKCADSNGNVAECFVYGSLKLHERLLPLSD